MPVNISRGNGKVIKSGADNQARTSGHVRVLSASKNPTSIAAPGLVEQ